MLSIFACDLMLLLYQVKLKYSYLSSASDENTMAAWVSL